MTLLSKKTISLCGMLLWSISMLWAQGERRSSVKLQTAKYIIQELYVDTVDEDKLTEAAIQGMLKDLDPHSSYVTAEDVRRFNESIQGNFEGIGIQYNMLTDTLYVSQLVVGGPAEKAGILAGDKVLMVNDTLIAGVKLRTEDITRKIRGKKGSIVTLKVLRKGAKNLLTFQVVRDKIPLYSMDAAYMVNDSIGYIRVNNFSATTGKEVKDALINLKTKGMKHLIFDLQGNGGGVLASALSIGNELLPEQELIVYTEGRKSPRRDFYSTGKTGAFREGKLVILVDDFTASASEIVAGAVQDWDRGVIIGRRTFGKGLVQRPFDLPDGSMIRLTVSRYYTPAGRFIQRPYESRESYAKDFIERYNRGEMSSADSIHLPDSIRYTTLKKGRTVYGGGGIMPDIFVPIDTTYFTPYYRYLRDAGIVNKLSMELVDKHRAEWRKKYPTFALFLEKFVVTEDMLHRMIALGNSADVPYKKEEYEQSKTLLMHQIKGLIGRDLWGLSEYFQVTNVLNPTYLRAIEELQKP